MSAFQKELVCKKSLLKKFSKIHRCFLWRRCFLYILQNLKEHTFSQKTSSGCFWHLQQSRFPILILYVMNWQLRHEEWGRIVEQETSFSYVFYSEWSLSSLKYKFDIKFSVIPPLDQNLMKNNHNKLLILKTYVHCLHHRFINKK